MTDEYLSPVISHGQSCGSAACPLDSGLNHQLSQRFLQCGHKLIVKVNKQKNSDKENPIYNQYGKKLAILFAENIKICG